MHVHVIVQIKTEWVMRCLESEIEARVLLVRSFPPTAAPGTAYACNSFDWCGGRPLQTPNALSCTTASLCTNHKLWVNVFEAYRVVHPKQTMMQLEREP